MGHADLKTTMRYLHYRQRFDEADLLSEVFDEKRVPKLVPSSPDLGAPGTNSEHETVPSKTQRRG